MAAKLAVSLFFNGFLIGNEFVDHVQFFADKARRKIAPAYHEDKVHEQFIVGMPFPVCAPSVFEYLAAGGGFNIDAVVPENIPEERERCAVIFRIYEGHFFHPPDGVLPEQERDEEQVRIITSNKPKLTAAYKSG